MWLCNIPHLYSPTVAWYLFDRQIKILEISYPGREEKSCRMNDFERELSDLCRSAPVVCPSLFICTHFDKDRPQWVDGLFQSLMFGTRQLFCLINPPLNIVTLTILSTWPPLIDLVLIITGSMTTGFVGTVSPGPLFRYVKQLHHALCH